MSNARNLADLLSSTGDVKATRLSNVPASDDASALTTGTLPVARIADNAITDAKIAGMSSSKLSGALPAISGAALTGVQPFPSGTVMVFYQSSAPTGWTKSTSHNNKALRVVSGTGGGSGGSWDLSSGVTSSSTGSHTHSFSDSSSTTSSAGSHTHTGASHTHSGPSHTHSTPNHSHSHSLSAGSHTLSESQMPSHRHKQGKPNDARSNNAGTWYGTNDFKSWYGEAYSTHYPWTYYTGGSSSHSHSLSGSISSGGGSTTGSASGTTGAGGTGDTSSNGSHTHTVAVSGTTGSNSNHTHTISAPKYIDVIVCSKD